MKKLVYLALLMAAPVAASAQSIIITENDAPQIGESWMDVSDYRQGVHQITAGGASQVWDYSSAFIASDTMYSNFVPVSAVPAGYSASFPSAQMASYSPGDSAAIFFKKNSTGFYIDGIGLDSLDIMGFTISSLPFNPDRLVVPGPFTFADTRSHTTRLVIEATFGGAPARYALTTYQTFTADAYGELTTPAISNVNTLRVREFSYSVDTTYVNGGFGWFPIDNTPPHDTTITYTWYRNGAGARVMSIEEDASNPGSSLYASYLGQVVASAPAQNATTANTNVYPNPSAGQLVNFEFENANASRLVVTDMLGRQVQTENIAGLTRLVLFTNRLDAGAYIYSVLDKNGNITDNGRFVVVK